MSDRDEITLLRTVVENLLMGIALLVLTVGLWLNTAWSWWLVVVVFVLLLAVWEEVIRVSRALYLDAKHRDCPHWATRCPICGQKFEVKR